MVYNVALARTIPIYYTLAQLIEVDMLYLKGVEIRRLRAYTCPCDEKEERGEYLEDITRGSHGY